MNLIPKRLRQFSNVRIYNWLNHELIVRFLEHAAQEHASGKLADIGCGSKPYVPIFAPFVDDHIGVDLEGCVHGNDTVDVFGTAYETNLGSESCNTILCSEVLEHLEEPKEAIGEMHRILADNGKVILTVPFFWPVHEAPRDFFRYTTHGLQHLFEQESFTIVEIRPLTGFWAMIIQMFIYGTRSWARFILVRPIAYFVFHILQHLALQVNRFDKKTQFTNLYGVVAVKRAPGNAE